MPNGHMPSWEEWNEQLSDEQRQYSLYKVLDSLDNRISCREDECEKRMVICKNEFESLKKRKWFDRGAALVGGAISGALGALGIKIGT